MLFIAEVKTRSPYGYRSPHEFGELLAKANRVGDVIAIHTDHRWGGSLYVLRDVFKNEEITKPILAKGIHFYEGEAAQAFEYGATWALKVGQRRSSHPQVWCEPLHGQWDGTTSDGVVVCNARDLSDGSFDHDLWKVARKNHRGTLIQASGIKTPEDVHPDADGFIVGEALMDWPEPEGYTPPPPEPDAQRNEGGRWRR